MSALADLTASDVARNVATIEQVTRAGADSPDLYLALAVGHVRLGVFSKALAELDRAMETEAGNPEVYFFSAVSLMGGKKPFLHTLAEVRQMDAFLDSAIMLEGRGVFYYLKAYLTKDYFERKFLRPPVGSAELVARALAGGLSIHDADYLFSLLSLENTIPIG